MRPSRREFVAGVAALSAAACPAEKPRRDAGERTPRNLLVLLADDMGGRDLGCYGNRDVRTPRLDALAAGGMRFERAYTAVGVCQPSRSSLYTGMYPTRHGAMGFDPIRKDIATWPELLREQGVATAMIGKLDVDPLAKFPFEHLVKANEMSSRRAGDVWERHFRDFLSRAHRRRFAAVVGLVDPHRPFDELKPATGPDAAALSVPKSLWDCAGTRSELAQYYGCIERLDATIARLMAALEEYGHADDTLVIFTADNGPSFPFAKATLYEAGVRMPMIAHGPGIARGTSSEFVGLIDLLPTALDVFGASPRELDGRSLLPTLHRGRPMGRPGFVTMQNKNNRESSRPSRAFNGRRYKYIRNFGEDSADVSNVVGHTATWESGRELAQSDAAVAQRMRQYLYRPSEELYDLEDDPCELANLADLPGHAAMRDAMRSALRDWMVKNSDPLLAEWGE